MIFLSKVNPGIAEIRDKAISCCVVEVLNEYGFVSAPLIQRSSIIVGKLKYGIIVKYLYYVKKILTINVIAYPNLPYIFDDLASTLVVIK